MTEKIKPDYGALSDAAYTQRINTPAQNPFYHRQFHEPLVEEARAGFPNPTIVDIAAGHAHELVSIIEESSDVRLVAVDVARKTLVDSTMGRIKSRLLYSLEPEAQETETQHDGYRETTVNHPDSLVSGITTNPTENICVAADVKNLVPMSKGFADAGIALNAMVYVPHDMLRGLRACLKPGAPASVNFRNATNPHNSPFYQFYLNDGAEIYDDELQIDGENLPLRVLDYRRCADVAVRSLDRQIYLTNVDDMVRLIQVSGFNVEDHRPFHFKSPSNPDNEIDVFKLRAI